MENQQDKKRQLAAILFTDIVGYTFMMQQNETQAVAIVKHYISVLQKTISEHEGVILNDYGDGSLCTFSSTTQAVRCAISIQKQLQEHPMVPLRIGMHVGEIFFEHGKVLGDGVNVASRVQSLGQANTILFSKEVCDIIKNQPDFKPVSLGMFEFKNVNEPIEVFALANEELFVPKRNSLEGKLKDTKRRPAGKNLIIATILCIIILIAGFFIYEKITETSFSGEKSIAVLPFDNINMPDSEVYVSDGITEDIINNLSKISSLKKVIAWFSVKGFKNTTKSAKQIADELGVAAILTGTIQKEAGSIHIIVELIDVNTNKRLWGEDYTYSNKDILSIQSSVAGEIVAALKANITSEEKKNIGKNYTENVEAYKYYIRGRTFWESRSSANFDSAEEYYKKAIALDPQYALAYAGIADCYTFNYKGMSQLDAIPIARAYATRALAIDSNLSEGLTTLGFIEFNFDYNWNEAKKTLAKALTIDPNNSTAHLYYGITLQYTGDEDKGLKEQEKAIDLNPLAYAPNWVLGRNYYFAGRYKDAIIQLEKAKELAPKNDEACFWSLGLVYLAQKMNEKAQVEYDQLPVNPTNPIDNVDIMKSYFYASTGNSEKASALIEKGLKEDPNVSVYRLAQTYVALGNLDLALNYLEEGYRIHELHMFCLKIDPVFNPLKNEPRFKELLQKMNLE